MDYPTLGGGYAFLWDAARKGRLSHAYLLGGPRGVGKATFARALVASLFCERAVKPCGECESCRRVLTRNEPDMIEVLSPEDKPIPIERIRQVITQISRHSFGGGARVVLFEPAEKLTPAAQNCLLKSLEDPPANVLFFLLSHEPGALLGTIASRCSLVRLAPWTDERLRVPLARMGYAPENIEAALPRAGGLIGQALAVLSDETAQAELNTLTQRILSIKHDADAVALSTLLKDDRGCADKTLTALEQALQQALMVRTGWMSAQAVTDGALREWCQNGSVEELTALMKAVFDTRKRRLSQVNWQAGIDRLLMKILEAKTRWQQS
ncbi:MAG: DNA polymerase III subunit [Eubacteriales bacterium]|nr:DNA polymerase III subunit [Eubacteriales bacterium]